MANKKLIIGLGVAGGLGLAAYLASRADASPLSQPKYPAAPPAPPPPAPPRPAPVPGKPAAAPAPGKPTAPAAPKAEGVVLPFGGVKPAGGGPGSGGGGTTGTPGGLGSVSGDANGVPGYASRGEKSDDPAGATPLEMGIKFNLDTQKGLPGNTTLPPLVPLTLVGYRWVEGAYRYVFSNPLSTTLAGFTEDALGKALASGGLKTIK